MIIFQRASDPVLQSNLAITEQRNLIGYSVMKRIPLLRGRYWCGIGGKSVEISVMSRIPLSRGPL